MTPADEIQALGEQLQDPATEQSLALEILGRLLQVTASVAMLKETKIGIVVGNLKKTSADTQVVDTCARLIAKWKDDARDQPQPQPKREAEQAGPVAKKPAPEEDFPEALRNSLGDAVRDKCVEMFFGCFPATKKGASGLVFKLENSLFEHSNRLADGRYKALFRSKFLNLKGNPQLVQGLLDGTLAADRFMAMSSEEMASETRKKENMEMERQNLHNTQAAKDSQAETDQFKCGKCQQRKCKYYQLQTRSADEPMTTFVTCVNCGNRWKFC